MHICHKPSCINPEHLRNRNRIEKPIGWEPHSGNRTNPPYGELNGKAKLTNKQVFQIRAKKGIVSQEELAKQYNVSSRTIRYVQSRRIWKHLKGVGKGNRITFLKGELNGSAKLTEEQVLEIREKRGVISQRKLAVKYGVSSTAIHYVQINKTWKHICKNGRFMKTELDMWKMTMDGWDNKVRPKECIQCGKDMQFASVSDSYGNNPDKDGDNIGFCVYVCGKCFIVCREHVEDYKGCVWIFKDNTIRFTK